ncbi:MAG: regulatory iron-sulfur-containing complex subunit RicT [Chitinophagaceae bacterium]
MGCGSCGTAKDGKPGGCKSNGGCSTGGCNRMNVHDWLANLPFSDPESSCKIVEVSFNQGSRKEFYRNPTFQYYEKGELVTVEGTSGFDVGEVSLNGELVRMQLKKRGVSEDAADMKRILRRSGPLDIEKCKESKSREKEALVRSRAMARQLNLQMKLAEVEFQADGKKATFYYTADDRVDFRELIRVFAGEFKVKVEMRQIGARQEAGKVGGIGSCGRELCCSTWLTDFKSVNTQAARYQNLSINQTKLSGQCGRLKCCLNYELDTYLDALKAFPENADDLMTTRGKAYLVKKDIFKNLMWYTLPDSSKQYPLAISRVKEIKEQNAKGVAVEELQPVEIVSSKQVEKEPEFVELVGQISLKSLDKNSRRGNNNRPPQGFNDRRDPRDRDGGNQNRSPRQGPPKEQQQQQKPPQGQRPPQQGQRPPQGPRPPQQGQRPPQQGQRPPQGPKPPQQQGQRPPQNQQRPPQQNQPRSPRPPRQQPPKEGGDNNG